MFTSRAEYRTLLRQDNADIRLTEKSYNLGLASETRYHRVLEKQSSVKKYVDFFEKTSYEINEANVVLKRAGYEPILQKAKLDKLYSRPNIKKEDIISMSPVIDYLKNNQIDEEIQNQAEIQIKYKGYIEKEKNNADKLQKLENIKIPPNFNYNELASLSYEAKEKLNNIKPSTLSQASRISGINPSDISVLLVKMGR